MTAARRLAAIIAADVAGYSRLMGEDEEGTHERLKRHLGELVNPKITEHRGRVVKNTGDGFLAEFPSVIDAVRCAVEIQRGMPDREPEVPEERRIRFRVGVNLGDVIVEEHDIFGDGVNVAARLETLAEPGGICVSRVVRDQVRDRLDYAFEDLGERQVKNIVRPVRVYAVLREPTRALTAAGAVVIPETAAAPRLSIVVLPFANLSNDPEQQYFADGITEDLTADLSRIAGMLVISRNTAFTYQGKRVDTKQIGRELSVRYVLEGSVRRLGNQIRINAQLIDAEKDMHLWAERFNGDTSDLFTLQDEITRRIAVALNLELWRAEAARPTRRPDAVDYIFRGRAVLLGGPPSRERYAEAIALFKQALALDPQSVDAQSFLAGVLAGRVIDNMADTTAADIVYADSLIGQALAASPRSCFAHYARGHVLRAQRRYAEAIPECEAALSANPNYVYALHGLASCKVRTGSIEEAIPLEEQAIRLSPRDPFIGPCYMLIGVVHLLLSNADEAIVWFEKACNHAPAHPNICAYLASAYALAGETDRAPPHSPRLAGRAGMTAKEHHPLEGRPRLLGSGIRDPLFEATYLAGLRKAGMPEG